MLSTGTVLKVAVKRATQTESEREMERVSVTYESSNHEK